MRRITQVKLFHEFSLEFQVLVFEFVFLYTELGFMRNHIYIGHYRNVRGLGKSMVVFRLLKKLRYSNKRSTVF